MASDRRRSPTALDWVREQVELYESSGGTHGNTLLDTGMPCILVTHTGNKTGLPPIVPWRLEIEPPTAETRDYFLNVIEVTDEASSPWHIVECTDRRYLTLTVGETILAMLRARLDAPPEAAASAPAGSRPPPAVKLSSDFP